MKEDSVDPGTALSIGYLAFQAINEEKTARVIGSTSRGIFLLTPKKRVIFISNQPFRSPLTIAFQEPLIQNNLVEPGMPVDFTQGRIEIPEAKLFLDVKNHEPWKPPIPSGLTDQSRNFRFRLQELISYLLAAREPLGFSYLLSPLLNFQSADILTSEQSETYSRVRHLEKTLTENDPVETMVILKSFLGLGRGLTPSGDDFIMGFLLALNRWPAVCHTPAFLPQLNQLVIQSAYLSTTAISANLIECATLGHSDERLMTAIDGLITGTLSTQACASNLIGLGSSSGIDALSGTLVAFDLCREKDCP